MLDKNQYSVFHRQNISFNINGVTYTHQTEENEVDGVQKLQFYTQIFYAIQLPVILILQVFTNNLYCTYLACYRMGVHSSCISYDDICYIPDAGTEQAETYRL